MNRRVFTGIGISSCFIPLALPGLSLAGNGGQQESQDGLYYEERFPTADKIARSWLGSDEWQAVQADITPVWNGELKLKSKEDSVHVAGVTTESFYFCLQTLLQPTHDVSTEITRVDQNLYAWTLSANKKNNRRLS